MNLLQGCYANRIRRCAKANSSSSVRMTNPVEHVPTGLRVLDFSQRAQGPHLSYIRPAGVFKATGGWVVIMSFLHHWKDLCAAMARPDLVDDPKLGTDAGRLANRAVMIKLIEDWLATFPDRDSAVAHMQQNAVPAAPVLSIEETVNHPHLRARGTVRTIEDRFAGKFDIPGMPLKFSEFPQPLPLEAATLGQHNGEVLSDLLGRSAEE